MKDDYEVVDPDTGEVVEVSWNRYWADSEAVAISLRRGRAVVLWRGAPVAWYTRGRRST